MEQRAGVSGTVLNDVFFTEKPIPGATVLKHLRVEISRQNSNLSEFKWDTESWFGEGDAVEL
jgi:hypothetical protein